MLESQATPQPSGFSPDGRTLVFHEQNPTTSWDVWALSLDGERKPTLLLGTPGMECCGVVSPDGRFLAYVTDESGRPEVHVTPYPGAGRKWQVSSQGGSYPRWRKDGREIVYQALDGSVTAAAVSTAGEGFSVGAETALFKTRVPVTNEYVLRPTADAQRFLVVETMGEDVALPLTLTLGWQALLRR